MKAGTGSKSKGKISISAMAEVAVITAVICILAPISIPVGPVPISLGLLAIFLGVYILGAKKGTIAVAIYILIGMVGLPVFTGFSGGFGKVLGPTGGYIIAYIPLAIIAGIFIDRFYDRIWLQVAGMLIGLAVLYAVGTIWLAFQAGLDVRAALMAGVIPFIPFDLAKIAISIVLGRAVRKALRRAGIKR